MNRRTWLKGSAALAAAAGMSTRFAEAAQANANASAKSGDREFYLLRRYTVNSGAQSRGTSSYFKDALLPALTRMGIGPVGAFSLSYGAETPQDLLVIPSTDCTALCMLDLHLAQDAAFVKAAEPHWNSPANTPLFDRVESQLSIAFEGYPKLTPPPKEARILQLRTYESPTFASHIRKVEMFHQGEFRIFKETGSQNVFFSDNLVGPRLPSLTYMLAHKDLATLDQNWKGFMANPDWKKLSGDPRYSGDPIVSRIDNLLLNPLPYSQI
ncbi:MAG: hypothetical protein NVSMB62_08170 [Acidobacteriaceae bacterium]